MSAKVIRQLSGRARSMGSHLIFFNAPHFNPEKALDLEALVVATKDWRAVSVITGIGEAWVNLGTAEFDQEPPPDDSRLWEEVSECSIRSDDDGVRLDDHQEPNESFVENLLVQEAPYFRMRVHALGRELGRELDMDRTGDLPTRSPERFAIQFWPSRPGPVTVLRKVNC